MDLKEQVLENLERFQLNNDIKQQNINHLCKIQDVANEIKMIRDTNIKSFKDNKPSINQISSLSKISRQTFYNNSILMEYTKLVIEDILSDDIFAVVEKLRNDIREKDTIINKMVERDALISLYKIKIEELQEKITSLEDIITQQKQSNNEIILENTSPKKTSSTITQKAESKVINMKR